MKTLSKICFFLVLVFISWQVSAQATMPRKGEKPKAMRDGVARVSGKLFQGKNGKVMPLTRTFKAQNGTMVSASGLVTYPDGRKEKLAEGYAINQEGEKVIYKDDMIIPETIRSHQKKVTGKEGTEVMITERVHTVIHDSTGRKAVRDTIRTTEIR